VADEERLEVGVAEAGEWRSAEGEGGEAGAVAPPLPDRASRSVTATRPLRVAPSLDRARACCAGERAGTSVRGICSVGGSSTGASAPSPFSSDGWRSTSASSAPSEKGSMPPASSSRSLMTLSGR
jgi:hypothetical protein